MKVSSLPKTMPEWGRHLRHLLVDPPDGQNTAEEGQRQRLLSALLLVHLGLVIILLVLQPVVSAGRFELLLDSFGLVYLLALYGISRTSYYRAAGVAIVLVWYIVIFSVDVLALGRFNTLYFLIVIVFIASLIFSLRTTLLHIVLLFLAQIAIIPLYPADMRVTEPIIFSMTLSAFIYITAYLRQRDLDRLTLGESRYRSLMDAATEALVIQDKAGKILDVNPAFERLMGYTAAEAIGRNAAALIHPPDRARGIQYWHSNASEPTQLEIQHKNGSVRTLEITIRQQQYQGQFAYVIAAQDVTDGKDAERQRIEHELRYQALFNNTADAVFVVGLDNQVMSVNDRTLEMLRASREDVEGYNYEKYILPDELHRSRQVLRAVLNGEHVPIYERRFQRADGSVFTGEVNIMLVRDSEKKPLYLQSIIRDTTVRRRMEEREFELAIQRERMKILQNFIDDASHYFRTPLTNLKTSAYLLNRFGHMPDKQREQLDVMDIQIERMEQLLDDLLMVARLDKEITDESRNARLDVNRLILQLLPVYFGESQHTLTDHRWEFLPSPEVLEIFGDRNRLSNAISNVIANARKYTPTGGTITIRTYQQNRMLVIEVQDTGIGITEAEMPHIFENFYRTDAARAMDSTSSGMGLPITRKIVHLHRGVIRVFSETGKGTTFQLILPLAGDWTSVTQEMAATLVKPVS